MLRDEATIIIRSGNGGPGAATFYREKFIPEGGPDGGDGGDGGDVIFEATTHMNTLSAFLRRRRWKAESGAPGTGQLCSGRSGADLVIKVPCGTTLRLQATDEIVADLTTPGQRVVVAAGGRGGKGNARFKSSINQTPRQFGPGQPGVELALKLDLTLIADVGIIGLPNAGKSTLLSRLSAARPKIAPYPFTTLEPQLGVVERVDRTMVLADIPGLIEGAAEGVGARTPFPAPCRALSAAVAHGGRVGGRCRGPAGGDPGAQPRVGALQPAAGGQTAALGAEQIGYPRRSAGYRTGACQNPRTGGIHYLLRQRRRAQDARGSPPAHGRRSPGDHGMNIKEVLRAMVQLRSSDLFLKVGGPPRVRVDGTVRQLGNTSMTKDDLKDAFSLLIDEHSRENFRKSHEADTAFEEEGLGRFRVQLLHAARQSWLRTAARAQRDPRLQGSRPPGRDLRAPFAAAARAWCW